MPFSYVMLSFVFGVVAKASDKKGSQSKRLTSKRKVLFTVFLLSCLCLLHQYLNCGMYLQARQKLVKEGTSSKRDLSGDQSGPGVSQSEGPPSKSSVSTEDASLLQRREFQPTDADVQSLPQSVSDGKSEDAAAVVPSESVVDGGGDAEAAPGSKNPDGDVGVPNESLVQPSPSLPDKEIEVVVASENLVDAPKKDVQGELEDSSKRDQDRLVETVVHVPPVGEGNVIQSTGDEAKEKVGTSINLDKKQEQKVADASTNLEREQGRRADTTSMKIQDQLEEVS